MNNVKQLLTALQTERLDTFLFRAQSIRFPLPRVYGGQVLAQALNSSSQTVAEDRYPHSLHAYFLRPGSFDQSIIYEVDPIRDGRSFTTRRVVGKQNGKAIFNCSISYQAREQGYQHQIDLPDDVPRPDELENDVAIAIREAGSREAAFDQRFRFDEKLVDIRTYLPHTYEDGEARAPRCGFWFKFSDLGDLSAAINHQTLLAFISDKGLLGASFLPHALSGKHSNMTIASLDHAMWLHTDFEVDDWLYYEITSPRSAYARGFCQGHFYNINGQMVASTSQEGLLRPHDTE